MKKLIFGFLFLILGLGGIFYVSKLEKKVDDAELVMITKAHDEQQQYNDVVALINSNNISSLDVASGRVSIWMQHLSAKEKERLKGHIALRRARIWFDEAEAYLASAIEVENAVKLPPPPPPLGTLEPSAQAPTPVPAPLHPLAAKLLSKALAKYEDARKEIEKVKESKDSDILSQITNADFNYHLNYLKGEICHRFLEYIADQETSLEMYTQAVTYYKYALQHRPNDIKTVVNIELLIKNQSSMLANSASPQIKQKQMLISKKPGLGKSSGN